jgi:hypothetical protein
MNNKEKKDFITNYIKGQKKEENVEISKGPNMQHAGW